MCWVCLVSVKVRVALSVVAVIVTEQVVVFFEFRHEVKFIAGASILWQARVRERQIWQSTPVVFAGWIYARLLVRQVVSSSGENFYFAVALADIWSHGNSHSRDFSRIQAKSVS